MMAMDAGYLLTIFVIGFIGSFISGMLGIGGAIINYPILLYVPPLLGYAGFGAHYVSGIVAVQVFFSTLAGLVAYRKGGFIDTKLLMIMGLSSLTGSFIGGFGSHLLTEKVINIIYGLLAVIAAVLMLFPKKEAVDDTRSELVFNKKLAGILALTVGVFAGIVGAGGAFILVPIMLVVLKLPTRVTIATSLGITFLSSIGSLIGKAATGQILYHPAVLMLIVSLIAAPLGVKVGKKISTKVLQSTLAILIAGTAVKIWLDIFMH
ncbi:hypothetical protein GA0061096_0061 [Fictibacillus enclensis]|nr:hypothetical protein GA0061096_0061 [Fictibacillus enclensis]